MGLVTPITMKTIQEPEKVRSNHLISAENKEGYQLPYMTGRSRSDQDLA